MSRRGGTSHLRGAFFILQLHDELIYETKEEDLIQVGHTLSHYTEHNANVAFQGPVSGRISPFLTLILLNSTLNMTFLNTYAPRCSLC